MDAKTLIIYYLEALIWFIFIFLFHLILVFVQIILGVNTTNFQTFTNAVFFLSLTIYFIPIFMVVGALSIFFNLIAEIIELSYNFGSYVLISLDAPLSQFLIPEFLILPRINIESLLDIFILIAEIGSNLLTPIV